MQGLCIGRREISTETDIFHLELKDSVVAARSGFILFGTILFLRINILVCDQKEERSIISLKAQARYMYCTLC